MEAGDPSPAQSSPDGAQRLLCAWTVRRSDRVTPGLNAGQVRACWSEFASCSELVHLFVTGLRSESVHHVKACRDGSRYWLTDVGPLLKHLRASSGDVVALAVTHGEELRAEINTEAARALAAHDFGSSGSARKQRRPALPASPGPTAAEGAAVAARIEAAADAVGGEDERVAAAPAQSRPARSQKCSRSASAGQQPPPELEPPSSRQRQQVVRPPPAHEKQRGSTPMRRRQQAAPSPPFDERQPRAMPARGKRRQQAAPLTADEQQPEVTPSTARKRRRSSARKRRQPDLQLEHEPLQERQQRVKRPRGRPRTMPRQQVQQAEEQRQQQAEQSQPSELQQEQEVEQASEQQPEADPSASGLSAAAPPPQPPSAEATAPSLRVPPPLPVELPVAEEPSWADVASDTSDDEQAEFIRYHKHGHPHGSSRVVGHGTVLLTRAKQAAADATEREFLAAASRAAAPRSRSGAWHGLGRRRGSQGSGMGGMDGFGASGGRGSRPAAQPMPLLPGEDLLGVERFFGEGRPLGSNGRLGPLPAAAAGGEGSGLLGEQRYQAAVQRARRLLGERMRRQGASKDEVGGMLRLLREFEAKCLGGGSASPEEGKQLCRELARRLRGVYNCSGRAPLVLDAHVMGAAALTEQEGRDDLQHMRTMERRFVIWTPQELGAADAERMAAAAPSGATPSPAGARGSRTGSQRAPNTVPRMLSPAPEARKQSAAPAAAAQHEAPSLQQAVDAAAAAAHVEPATERGEGGARRMLPWDAGLAGIWREFTERLKGKLYGDVTLSSTSAPVSCALNDTEWEGGRLRRRGVRQTADVLRQIAACREGRRPGRLYVTDGSMPDYHNQRQYPADAPGMPCGVDSRANAMFPHAARSDRATNLFHAIKTESTGTKSFTLFAPAGGGPNLTAFHFETKRRRSYNCGTGDFIIQPPATAEAMRKLMRVHAAVTGRHSRHGQLLPLEVYLEEGVPLVLHVRDTPHATLCELCEQSMHAFVTFGTVACSPPALKVSCNDFDLVWELDSCYWLEKVATLYTDLELFPEEGVPPDGADTWVMSAYLARRPHTRAQRAAGWERPWLCEAAAQGAGGGAAEADDSDLSWSADVIAVRCVEKMLDVLAGELAHTAAWAGEVPDARLAAQALRRARPVLQDMRRRAASETDAHRLGPDGEFQPRWPLECHFSREYVADVMAEVDAALQRCAPDPQPPSPQQQQEQPHLKGREAQEAQEGQPGAAGGGAVAPCLLAGEVHAAYAAAGEQERQRLAWQADAMLAAPEAGGQDAPALARLPPRVLRSHWLLWVQLEWEAAATAALSGKLDLQLLALRRRQRNAAEELLDGACRRLAEQHADDWHVQA